MDLPQVRPYAWTDGLIVEALGRNNRYFGYESDVGSGQCCNG